MRSIGTHVITAFLLLATFVPVFVGIPVHGGNGFSESCTVSVLLASGTFYVSSHITGTGGFLPSPQGDFLSSYQNGVLYNTQFQTSSIPNKSTSFTFTLAVSSNGVGAYTFQSLVGQLKGSRFNVLASCSGTYSL